MVGLTGLEPVTPRLSSACSNQLSYKPHLFKCRVQNLECRMKDILNSSPATLNRKLVELRRVELLTYSLQSYRSTN